MYLRSIISINSQKKTMLFHWNNNPVFGSDYPFPLSGKPRKTLRLHPYKEIAYLRFVC